MLDAHTHLNCNKLFPERENHISDFENAWWNRLINVWADSEYNKNWIIISKSYKWTSFIKCTIWFHPEYVADWVITLDNIDVYLKNLEQMYTENKEYIVAIWEIWIDVHCEFDPKLEIQKVLFEKQLDLAKKYNLPVVIHSRDDFETTLDILKEDKDPDYIERAAVKLKPQKPASNTRQQVAAKPAEKPVTKQTEKAVNKIKEKPVDNSVEPKTVTTKPVETVKVEETTTISEETQTAKLSAIEETKQEKPKADKKKAEERPIPLKAEDMPKAEIAEEELSEEEKAALADKIEENIDLFLAGDSTQKEEALNFLIQCGTSGLRAVEELIYNPNPDVRILAVRALPLFEAHKEEVKAILDDASDDIDPTVQEEIEKALSLL